MSLMDSIEVQYIWEAIRESERSDENLCSYTTMSDQLFQAQRASDALGDRAAQPEAEIRREPEHGDGKNTCGAVLPSQPRPDAS